MKEEKHGAQNIQHCIATTKLGSTMSSMKVTQNTENRQVPFVIYTTSTLKVLS